MVKIYDDKQIFTTFSWKEYISTKVKDYFVEFRETLADVLHIKMVEKGQPYIPTKVIPETKSPLSAEQKQTIPAPAMPVAKTYIPKEEIPSKKAETKVKQEKPRKEWTVERETMDKAILWVMGILIVGTMLFAITKTFGYLRLGIQSKFKIVPKNSEEVFCGGIANIQCPKGFYCKLEGKYPDTGGTCVKSSVLNDM